MYLILLLFDLDLDRVEVKVFSGDLDLIRSDSF